MLFVVPVVLFDMLKAKQLACVSESGQKCPAARSLSLRRAWIEISLPSNASTSTTTSSLSLRRAWIEISSPFRAFITVGLSLSLRRAWIEIGNFGTKPRSTPRRSPYGERGLKSGGIDWTSDAWCRSPYGERGLKSMHGHGAKAHTSRSPYGERGLKCYCLCRFRRVRSRSPYGERGLKYQRLS